MRTTWIRKIAALAAVLLAAMAVSQPAHPTAVAPGVPLRVLWAWERPEDLRSVDPRTTGVAFLAQTLELRGDAIRLRPRMQPLHVPDTGQLVAVTRIETHSSKLTAQQRARAVDAIAATAKLPRVAAVQIDFDAVASERDFYRDLLKDLRLRLPAGMPLSITALASWCYYDDWIAGLPVDEAVPMLFRLGIDEREIRTRLAANEDFHEPLCRTSYGLSIDEPWPALQPGRRIYVFSPAPWTRSAIAKLPGAQR